MVGFFGLILLAGCYESVFCLLTQMVGGYAFCFFSFVRFLPFFGFGCLFLHDKDFSLYQGLGLVWMLCGIGLYCFLAFVEGGSSSLGANKEDGGQKTGEGTGAAGSGPTAEQQGAAPDDERDHHVEGAQLDLDSDVSVVRSSGSSYGDYVHENIEERESLFSKRRTNRGRAGDHLLPAEISTSSGSECADHSDNDRRGPANEDDNRCGVTTPGALRLLFLGGRPVLVFVTLFLSVALLAWVRYRNLPGTAVDLSAISPAGAAGPLHRDDQQIAAGPSFPTATAAVPAPMSLLERRAGEGLDGRTARVVVVDRSSNRSGILDRGLSALADVLSGSKLFSTTEDTDTKEGVRVPPQPVGKNASRADGSNSVARKKSTAKTTPLDEKLKKLPAEQAPTTIQQSTSTLRASNAGAGAGLGGKSSNSTTPKPPQRVPPSIAAPVPEGILASIVDELTPSRTTNSPIRKLGLRTDLADGTVAVHHLFETSPPAQGSSEKAQGGRTTSTAGLGVPKESEKPDSSDESRERRSAARISGVEDEPQTHKEDGGLLSSDENRRLLLRAAEARKQDTRDGLSSGDLKKMELEEEDLAEDAGAQQSDGRAGPPEHQRRLASSGRASRGRTGGDHEKTEQTNHNDHDEKKPRDGDQPRDSHRDQHGRSPPEQKGLSLSHPKVGKGSSVFGICASPAFFEPEIYGDWASMDEKGVAISGVLDGLLTKLREAGRYFFTRWFGNECGKKRRSFKVSG